MNEFRCKCTKCGLEQSYRDLKSAYMDGWNFGKNAECFDCQRNSQSFVKNDNSIVDEVLNQD